MDIQKILNEYKEGNKGTPFFLLKDGRIVMGELINENNHLFYVIKDLEENYCIEDAQGQEVVDILKPEEEPTHHTFSPKGTKDS